MNNGIDQLLRELIRQQRRGRCIQASGVLCLLSLDELANPKKIGCTEKGNEDNSSTLTHDEFLILQPAVEAQLVECVLAIVHLAKRPILRPTAPW